MVFVLAPDEFTDVDALEKAKSYGSWNGMSVIAFGPKGGKIIGYDAKGKSIYANSAAAKKLVAQKKSTGGLAQVVGSWLTSLGIKGAFGLTKNTVDVPPEHGEMLKDSFGVKPILEGTKSVFSLAKLKPFIGKPLTPAKGEEVVYAAKAASGETEEPLPDFPTDLNTLKPTGQTLGSHGGKVFKDPNTGTRYLFKTENITIARAEEVASRIAKLILGPDKVQSTKYIKLNGKDGVLIRMFDSSEELSPEHGKPPIAKMQEHFDDIVQHHILDWVISNHDAHGGNFIVADDGLKGIDKGQAFKSFVHPGWNPNEALPQPGNFLASKSNPNNSKQIYGHFWDEVHKGNVKGDPLIPAAKVFEKLSKISPEQAQALIGPYVEAAAEHQGLSPVMLSNKILDRFANAKSHWDTFLSAILKQPVEIDDNFETMPEGKGSGKSVEKFEIPNEPKVLQKPSAKDALVPGEVHKVEKKFPWGKSPLYMTKMDNEMFQVMFDQPDGVKAQEFKTISAAAKWAWVHTKGYESKEAYEAGTGKKAPGVNYAFFGLKSPQQKPIAPKPVAVAPVSVPAPAAEGVLSVQAINSNIANAAVGVDVTYTDPAGVEVLANKTAPGKWTVAFGDGQTDEWNSALFLEALAASTNVVFHPGEGSDVPPESSATSFPDGPMVHAPTVAQLGAMEAGTTISWLSGPTHHELKKLDAGGWTQSADGQWLDTHGPIDAQKIIDHAHSVGNAPKKKSPKAAAPESSPPIDAQKIIPHTHAGPDGFPPDAKEWATHTQQSAELWLEKKTPDGKHTFADKASGWADWVPPPGVWVKGELKGKDIWFTTSVSGYDQHLTETITSTQIRFVVLDADGVIAQGPLSDYASDGLDDAISEYKTKTGIEQYGLKNTVFKEFFGNPPVFPPGSNFTNYDASITKPDTITKTPDAMTEAEKNAPIVATMSFSGAFNNLPEVLESPQPIHLKPSNKPGHHNIQINGLPSDEAITVLQKIKLAYGLDALSGHPKTSSWGGAFMTIPDAMLEKPVTLSVPAKDVPSIDVAAPSKSENNFQTMPDWEGEKFATQAMLDKLPFGTSLKSAAGYTYVKGGFPGEDKEWKEDFGGKAPASWSSEDMGDGDYSIVHQPASAPEEKPELTTTQKDYLAAFPKKLPKSWSLKKKLVPALEDLPKGTILEAANGKQYTKVGQDYLSSMQWLWTNPPEGHYIGSYDKSKTNYAMAQAVQMLGGTAVQLPDTASAIQKILEDAPPPAPTKYTPKPVDPVVAAKREWAKENKQVTSEQSHRLSYLFHGAGLDEAPYARQTSGGDIVVGDGTPEFAAKLEGLGLPVQKVETPFGEMFQFSSSGLEKATPGANKITGPDGVEYPGGTVFEEKDIHQPIIELFASEFPGYTKHTPYVDKDTGPAKDGSVTIKFLGLTDDQTAQVDWAINQLKEWGVEYSGNPPWKGGNYTMFGPIPADVLTKKIKTGTSVQPTLPPIPEPFQAKSLGVSVGVQNEGQLAVSNRSDLSDPKSITPTMMGSTIRFGEGGVLMDGQLRMHRIKLPGGEVVHRFVGELTRTPNTLDYDKHFPFQFSHSDEEDKLLQKYFPKSQFKVMNFEEETGTWGMRDDGTNPHTAGTQGSAGADLSGGAKVYRFGYDKTHPRTFVVDVPVEGDAEQALADAMQKLGVPVDAAMAEPDEQDERILKKIQLLRSAMGNMGFIRISKMGLDEKSKNEREKILDKELKANAVLGQTIDSAQLVVGADGYHHVIATDLDEKIKKHNVRGIVSGVSTAGIVRLLAVQKGYGGGGQTLWTGNTRDINDNSSTGSGYSDQNDGGAVGRFYRLISDNNTETQSNGSHKPKVVFHPRVLRKTNWYSFTGDHYGAQTSTHKMLSRDKFWDVASGANEVVVENVSPKDCIGVIVQSSSDKNAIVAALTELGIDDWNGVPLDKFVVLNESVSWGLGTAIDKLPGSKEPL